MNHTPQLLPKILPYIYLLISGILYTLTPAAFEQASNFRYMPGVGSEPIVPLIATVLLVLAVKAGRKQKGGKEDVNIL